MSQNNSNNNSSNSNSNNSDNKSTYPSIGLPPPVPLTGMTEAVYRQYMSEYGLVPATAWVSEETLQQRQYVPIPSPPSSTNTSLTTEIQGCRCCR